MGIKIISFYDKVELKPNKKSTGLADVFETVKTDKGLVYKKVNTINRQALMNSEAKNCDISILYKRLIKGDASVLETREGLYLNTVNAPKDIYEMNNYSKYIEKYFNSNDLLKKVYNNDFAKYFIDYSKGLNIVKEKIDKYTFDIYNSIKKDMTEKKSKEFKDDKEIKGDK